MNPIKLIINIKLKQNGKSKHKTRKSYTEVYRYGDGDGSGKFISRFHIGDKRDFRATLKKFKGNNVVYIDNLPCIIHSIKGNIAKAETIYIDNLSTIPCYIAKRGNLFAHGKTIKEALQEVERKYYSQLNIDDKIAEFKRIFNDEDKYTAKDFFEWHGILTGSCKYGREDFMQRRNIAMGDLYTVAEFVELCAFEYGGETIKKINL